MQMHATPCGNHVSPHRRLQTRLQPQAHRFQRPSAGSRPSHTQISALPFSKYVASTLAATVLLATAGPALAGNKVAEFAASGLIFKDTVEVTAFDDPEIDGITIYISDFKRSLADKLSKDFFSEPSQASVGCALSGPVKIKNVKSISGLEGQEVFSEKKGLNFFKDKTVRIRRVLDPERRNVLYISYSTRLSSAADEGVTSGRYKTSVCALHLPETPAPTPAISEEQAEAKAQAQLN